MTLLPTDDGKRVSLAAPSALPRAMSDAIPRLLFLARGPGTLAALRPLEATRRFTAQVPPRSSSPHKVPRDPRGSRRSPRGSHRPRPRGPPQVSGWEAPQAGQENFFPRFFFVLACSRPRCKAGAARRILAAGEAFCRRRRRRRRANYLAAVGAPSRDANAAGERPRRRPRRRRGLAWPPVTRKENRRRDPR